MLAKVTKLAVNFQLNIFYFSSDWYLFYNSCNNNRLQRYTRDEATVARNKVVLNTFCNKFSL